VSLGSYSYGLPMCHGVLTSSQDDLTDRTKNNILDRGGCAAGVTPVVAAGQVYDYLLYSTDEVTP
jgi:hypothetical protein